jgi:peroxiredoxin Q/BCP
MPRARSALAALVAAGLAACAAADDSKLKVKAGDKFPDVALPATQAEKVKKDAKELSIADLKGKTVVVFFYPKANTKG